VVGRVVLAVLLVAASLAGCGGHKGSAGPGQDPDPDASDASRPADVPGEAGLPDSPGPIDATSRADAPASAPDSWDQSGTSDAADSGSVSDAADSGSVSDAVDSGSVSDAADSGSVSDAADSGSVSDAADAADLPDTGLDVVPESFPFSACGASGGNGKDGVPMCSVPGGPFVMGAGPDVCAALEPFVAVADCQLALLDEQPAHYVTLPPFRIDQTEIRASQYRKCMLQGACPLPTGVTYCGLSGPGPGQPPAPAAGDGTGTVTGTFSCEACGVLPAGTSARFGVTTAFPQGLPVAFVMTQVDALPYSFTIDNVPEGDYFVAGQLDMPPPCPSKPGLEDFVAVSGGIASPEKVTVVAGQTTGGVKLQAVHGFLVVPFPQESTLANADSEMLPVNLLDWYRAKAYCEWAGKRLCTEAEWELAAAGTSGQKFPWGDNWADGMGNGYEPGADPFDWISPVGSFPLAVSPCGCLDMAGNLMEFVQDWYDDGYYAVSPADNPLGPCDAAAACATADMKVLRGLAWRKESGTGLGLQYDSLVYRRIPYHPEGFFYDDVGSRCCQSL